MAMPISTKSENCIENRASVDQNQGKKMSGATIMMPCVYPGAIKCFISCGSPKARFVIVKRQS